MARQPARLPAVADMVLARPNPGWGRSQARRQGYDYPDTRGLGSLLPGWIMGWRWLTRPAQPLCPEQAKASGPDETAWLTLFPVPGEDSRRVPWHVGHK